MSADDRNVRILQRIQKYCREIYDFIAGIDYSTFEEVLQINRACIFTLEQIGECVKGLSEDFKKAHVHIPWQEIRRFCRMLTWVGNDKESASVII